MKWSLTFWQVKVMPGFTFSSLCTADEVKVDLQGKTCSCHVLGDRKNTVKSWILFQSVNWQHQSESIPGYPLWINLFLIVIG